MINQNGLQMQDIIRIIGKSWEDWSTSPENKKDTGVIVFNGSSVCPWQAYENIVVMVTNRVKNSNGKFVDYFCRAADVIKGDNVWEHNIVKEIELIAEPRINVKMHYGQEKEGPGFEEEIDDQGIIFNSQLCYKIGDWIKWTITGEIRKIKSLSPFAWENDADSGSNLRKNPEEYKLATIEEIKEILKRKK